MLLQRTEVSAARTEQGVNIIPRKDKKIQKRTEHEEQLWFKDLQHYRTAGEAKIILLKRKCGLIRTGIGGLSVQMLDRFRNLGS
jgi:IS5 family transposase